jgi:hypothetical protein
MARVDAEVNRLNNQVLVRYFERVAAGDPLSACVAANSSLPAGRFFVNVWRDWRRLPAAVTFRPSRSLCRRGELTGHVAGSRASCCASRVSRRPPKRGECAGADRRRRHRRSVGRLEAGEVGLQGFPARRTESSAGRQLARRSQRSQRLSARRALPAAADARSDGRARAARRTRRVAGDPRAERPRYDERYLCADAAGTAVSQRLVAGRRRAATRREPRPSARSTGAFTR